MNHIIEKEQYLSVVSAWKQSKTHTAQEHIIYNLLRGFDIKRGFTPIKNQNKLANGLNEWSGYNEAVSDARRMLRTPDLSVTKYRTEEQVAKLTEIEDQRMKQINLRFGLEFTPELREKLKELLK